MFLELWNYFRGYVVIEVSGFSVERFINLAAHRGIYIWDVCPKGSKVTMKMSIKGFKKLKGCTKKTRCKMRITEKRGLPFFTFRYRKRKVFAFGILFFIAALYLLSSFIWVIEINGNKRIKTGALVEYCDELGLKPGAFKHTLNTKEMTNHFMTRFSDLSWMAIDIKGTKVKINVVETIDAPPVIDKTTPCDVIAASSGIITDVVVISGTQLVKVRDIVKKGDTLVSGMLTIMDGEEIKGYHYTHANAEVYAKITYEINLSENLTYVRRDYTGASKKLYTVNVLKHKINLINTGISYKNYDKITYNKPLDLGGDFALPVSVDITTCSEYTPVTIERSVDEAKKLLGEKVDSMIEKQQETTEDMIVLNRDMQFFEEDGKVSVKALITVQTRIDEQKAVSPSKAREIEMQNKEEPIDEEN